MTRARLAASAVAVLLSFASPATAIGQAESAPGADNDLAKATFAGGCFWCMEPPYDELDGVVSTTSGYAGGRTRNPTYQEVSAGGTGHAEVVEIVYDPEKISYERLLDVFWRNVDPLDDGGQFCDRGSQYRTAIFVHDAAQRASAEKSKAVLRSSGRLQGKIVTEIIDAPAFYRAEEYHQDYYQKNPLRYKYYRFSCGRDRRLKQVWGEQATH
ncbi:MAG: peptide-methionine (S)-S-oxide reductase MsrA [Luteitalea sp.]|nr:peptide-methionine (S)-S-oxide reductase MsrA [Luteitalea sp.]